ncbi:MAG: adenylate/guanylate cyclase domain-containing protein [Acidimicrobiia bacterium]|nr:adenylate/guanylate cyclase domain-containing protein [Acidimicrobiia bacterium]
MSALSVAIALLARWTTTLDRQHLLAALLTSANGVVILALATIGGALPGYGVAAATLLFARGFVSRTRFIFAALRTAVIGLAFGVAVATYSGPANLVLDVLLFAAGAVGVLLALHILERNRRRVFFQDLVIREQTEQLAVEHQKSEALIHNILPESIAERLLSGERTIAVDYPSVTVLFGDIVGFTPLAAQLRARDVIDVLGRLFLSFDQLASEHDVVKIKTIGDAYMAVGGLTPDDDDHAAGGRSPGPRDDRGGGPARGSRAAAPALRVGVHSGPAVGGVIGSQRLAFDLWGDTVNVASRLQELGPPGRVHIGEGTMLLIRDQFACEPLGAHELRGHSNMQTFAVVGPIAHSVLPASVSPIPVGGD